jgi:PASTA domain
VTGRGGARLGVLLAGLVLALAASPLAALPLTETGRRAYDTARSADDGATVAFEEGEKTLALVKALAPDRDAVPPALRPFLEEGDAAHQALTGYRRLAQTGSTDALQLLADVTRLPSGAAPDVVRRDTLEQHALLAAREASIMAARARAEAERLRAILAEARLAMAEGKAAPAPRGARGAAPARGAGQGPQVDEARPGETVVPNLIGGRLDAAVRDLETAGLRLGPVTGPRDGYVVKQSPDGGASAPRQSTVAVTLSATAATIAPFP